MPGLDDYLTMRLHSAGGEPTFAMLEIVNGAEVPAAEMDSAAVLALKEMAILVAASTTTGTASPGRRATSARTRTSSPS